MEDRKKYTESPENDKRRLDISTKFVKMGKSLIFEGKDKDDYCIISAGNMLILLSGLILKSEDMADFNNLCSMFTAKRILDDMMDSPMGAAQMGGNLMDKMNKMKGDMGPLNGNMGEISEIMEFLAKNGELGDMDGFEDFFTNDDDDKPKGD